MPFEILQELDPLNTVIKVIGVGGGGGNAVEIITGGGANLRAIDEVARDVFGVPVRIGAPLCFDEKNALSMRPNASVAAGLLMAADKTRAAGDSRSYRTPSLLNLSGRIRTVFFGDY